MDPLDEAVALLTDSPPSVAESVGHATALACIEAVKELRRLNDWLEHRDRPEPPTVPAAALYECPKRWCAAARRPSNGPGRCPDCGWVLVPVNPPACPVPPKGEPPF